MSNTMREILFRGKQVDNGEWIKGFLTKSRNIEEKPALLKPCIDYEEKGVMMSSIVDPSTVGQFTGLADKNGNKIFEGDILIFYNGEEFSNYEVIWFGNAYKVLMEGEMEIQDDLDLFFCEHSEVIGNIHDNPELLEEKK